MTLNEDEQSGEVTGSFDVRASYGTSEESLSYSGTDFSGMGSSTATAINNIETTVQEDNLDNVVELSNNVLSFITENPSVNLSTWGEHNYIGSGRVTLNGVSLTLGDAAQEQALSVLSAADGASSDADLNAAYGIVNMDIVYGDDESPSAIAGIEELVNLFSNVAEFSFNGEGELTLTNGSNYITGLGLDARRVVFSSSLPASTGTYTVSPSGAVELVIAGKSTYGFADSEGDLITLSDPASRYYGVKLGEGVTKASLANTIFDLQGIVIDSSNVSLNASTYVGSTATFDLDEDELTLTLSGDITKAVAEFSDSTLPSVTTETETLGLISNPIIVADNGRLSPITFDNSGLELEGFVAANGGLLLRVVDMTSVESGQSGSPAGLKSIDEDGVDKFYSVADAPFNGDTPKICDQDLGTTESCVVFRAPINNEYIVYFGDAGEILFGIWTEGVSGGGSTPFTSDVRDNLTALLGLLTEDEEVTITQGVLFGFPQ